MDAGESQNRNYPTDAGLLEIETYVEVSDERRLVYC